MTNTTTVRRNSKEWKRMWSALAAEFGDTQAVNGFEVWQYRCTVNGRHEFVHRSHPTHGRVVWTTEARS